MIWSVHLFNFPSNDPDFLENVDVIRISSSPDFLKIFLFGLWLLLFYSLGPRSCFCLKTCKKQISDDKIRFSVLKCWKSCFIRYAEINPLKTWTRTWEVLHVTIEEITLLGWKSCFLSNSVIVCIFQVESEPLRSVSHKVATVGD